MTGTYLKGIGLLVGMIFGAGVFALPFVIVKAGIFWGIFHFILTFSLMLFLHFLYSDIAYFCGGRRRFTGFVEMLLGAKAKWFAFFITIASYYGAFLVYGILGGIFASNISDNFLSPHFFSILFLLTAGALVFLHFNKIAAINFYLTIPLLGLVVYLAIVASPFIKLSNFPLVFFNFSPSFYWFLPYGVFLFAFAGFSALPEVRDIFSNLPRGNFRQAILISLLLVGVFYAIFIFTIIGVSGANTTEDALAGIASVLGQGALLVGSLIGFLAVFTSFIALGVDLKDIFHYDLRFPQFLAWLCVVAPPLLLFSLGAADFVKILGIIGAIGIGATGIFIVLMARKLANRLSAESSRFGWLTIGLIAIGIIIAIISELKMIG